MAFDKKAYQKEYMKAYQQSEKYKAHRQSEKRKTYQKAYAKANKEKIAARNKAYMKAYREANREKRKASQKAYMKTPGGKTASAKRNTKRKREMGYIPLNKPFAGSEGHHVDAERVIHIPKYLHRMFPHNHRKPGTMILINAAAYQFLNGKSVQITFKA